MAKQEKFLRDIKKRARKGAKFNPTGVAKGVQELNLKQTKQQNMTYQDYKKLILGK
jgi:hypothetical protein